METSSLRGAFILGLSVIIASATFGMFFYQSRAVENTVRVVGAATGRFTSDVVKWRLVLGRQVGIDAVREGYVQVAKDLDALLDELHSRGIESSEINIQPAAAQPVYSQQGGVSGYTIQQSLFVVSTKVDTLENLALNPGGILTKGIVIQSTYLEYHFSKLSEIKRSLLADATQDAQGRAEEIARTAGSSIAAMSSARAGVFQINEPYSTEVTDYGVYNTSTREKDITVTVNASFVMK